MGRWYIYYIDPIKSTKFSKYTIDGWCGYSIPFWYDILHIIRYYQFNLILTNQPRVVEVFPFVVPCTLGLWDSS